jgi:4-amino-4-deoxy-L-arabinose transferase-like glycosyltransferase
MHALRYIAIVWILIALFGPGMDFLLKPTGVLLFLCALLLLVGLLPDPDDKSEDA